MPFILNQQGIPSARVFTCRDERFKQLTIVQAHPNSSDTGKQKKKTFISDHRTDNGEIIGVMTRVRGYMNDCDYTAYSSVHCTFKVVCKMTHSHSAGVWVPGSVTLSHSCEDASEGGPEGLSSSSSSGTEPGPLPSDERGELTSKLTSCITSCDRSD